MKREYFEQYDFDVTETLNEIADEIFDDLIINFTPSLSNCYLRSDPRHDDLTNIPGFFLESKSDAFDHYPGPIIKPISLFDAIVTYAEDGELNFTTDNLNIYAEVLEAIAVQLRTQAIKIEKDARKAGTWPEEK